MREHIFLTEHHLAFILSNNYHNYLWPITLLMIQLATAIVPPPSSVHTRVFYLHWWNICICPLLLLRSPQSGIPQHSPPHSYQHSSVKITNLCVCNVAAKWQSDDETNSESEVYQVTSYNQPWVHWYGECYNCYNMLVIKIKVFKILIT